MSAIPAPQRSPLPASWLCGTVLFVFLCGVGLLFFRGSLLTSDEVIMAETARSMALRGTLELPQELYGQTVSKYGIGAPLLAIPFVWLEGILIDEEYLALGSTLTPLLNILLFAAAGLIAALFVQGSRRWLAAAVVLIASPLLPAAGTFFSEPLAGVGLMLLAFGLLSEKQSIRLTIVAAALGAFFAIAARMSMLPVVCLLLAAGFIFRAENARILSGAAGATLALIVAASINAIYRGSPFATGYEGEEFTTPLPIGLYGLLLSPERGILIFFPALLLPFICWKTLSENMKRLTLVAAVCVGFSLVFHGLFWTWHGGWTQGPRFLLPSSLLFLPPVVELVSRWRILPSIQKTLAQAALIWSALLAYIYSTSSAFLWWNQLWGFHREENEWLFIPQLSLWAAWLEGVPLRSGESLFVQNSPTLLSAIGLAFCALAVYPLFVTWRGHLGTDVPPEPTEPPRTLKEDLLRPNLLVLLFLGIWLQAILALLAGPRGWTSEFDQTGDPPSRYLFVEGGEGIYSGWLRKPVAGAITFHIKANALFELRVNGETVLQQTEAIPQHLQQVTLDLPVGDHLIEAMLKAKSPNDRTLFQLYANWPGGGQYLKPLGGRWITPEPLSQFERRVAWFEARFWVFFALLLALQLLFYYQRSLNREGLRL